MVLTLRILELRICMVKPIKTGSCCWNKTERLLQLGNNFCPLSVIFRDMLCKKQLAKNYRCKLPGIIQNSVQLNHFLKHWSNRTTVYDKKWKFNTKLQFLKNKVRGTDCQLWWQTPPSVTAAQQTAVWQDTHSSQAQGFLKSISCHWPLHRFVPAMLQVGSCIKLESFLILGEKVAPVNWH